MFRNMPVILLVTILAVFFLDGALPLSVKSILYALSLTTKSFIVFLLPAVIFMLIFKTTAQFAGKATALLLLIFGMVICSNFLSTMVSYLVGSGVHAMDLAITLPEEVSGIAPAWVWGLPKWIGNDTAIFSGVILGVLFSLVKPEWGRKLSTYFEKWVSGLLRLFVAVIPVFLIGFLIKLVHDKVIESIIRDYAFIFAVVALAQFGYIGLLYFLTSKGHLTSFFASIKNMFPAALAGFSSMSSAAAMPLTIVGTEKNVDDPMLARIAVPSTVNIHLIGDCFAIPIFAFAVMKNFGVEAPLFSSYLIFAFYFVMAKFSVAAIPGGGIIVMLPFLESCLGFTPEMASLITALYILFDPVITSANVLGNGAFAMGVKRVRSLLGQASSTSEEQRTEN